MANGLGASLKATLTLRTELPIQGGWNHGPFMVQCLLTFIDEESQRKVRYLFKVLGLWEVRICPYLLATDAILSTLLWRRRGGRNEIR